MRGCIPVVSLARLDSAVGRLAANSPSPHNRYGLPSCIHADHARPPNLLATLRATRHGAANRRDSSTLLENLAVCEKGDVRYSI